MTAPTISSDRRKRVRARPQPDPSEGRPTSVRPSTSAALVITGRVGGHDDLRPRQLVALLHRTAFTEQRGKVAPVSLRKMQRAAPRPRKRAQPRPPRLQAVDELGTDHPLRRAIDLGGDHGAGHGRRQIQGLYRIGHTALGRQQEPGAHRQRRSRRTPRRADEAAATRRSHLAEHQAPGRRQRRRPGATAASSGRCRCARRPRHPERSRR